MKFEDSSFNASQINEAVHGSATVDASVYQPRSDGTQFNACQFNIGPGWEAASQIADNTLSVAQELVLQGNMSAGLAALQNVLTSESFCNFSENTKRLAAVIYCDFSLQVGRPQEALDWLSTLDRQLREDKALKAWWAWLNHSLGDPDALDELRAIQKVFPDSPTVLTVCLFAGDDLRSAAIDALQAWREAGDMSEVDGYRVALLHLSNILSEQGKFEEARDCLALVEPKGETENYKLQCMDIVFRVQRLISKPNVVNLDHVTVEDWSDIVDMTAAVNQVILRAKQQFEFHEAYSLKSLLLALFQKHQQAIDAFPFQSLQHVGVQALRNLGNSYQSLGKWPELADFISKLEPQFRTELADHHFVALINQGKFNEAQAIESVSAGLRSVLDEAKGTPEVALELDSVEGIGLAIQVARNRYFKSKDENCIEFLISLTPDGLREKFLLAEALLECGCGDDALRIYEDIFAELGPGIGSHFVSFLGLLLERGRRALVSDYMDRCPRQMIFSYPQLTRLFVQYVQVAKGQRAVFNELNPLITEMEDLSFRNVWLQAAHNVGANEEARMKLEAWGLDSSGTVTEQADYLALAAHFLPAADVRRRLYELMHENSRNVNIQRAIFSVFFLLSGRDSEAAHISPSLVGSSCGVAVGGDMVLIDDSLAGSASPYYLLSSDESVADLIGKSVGEEVNYLGKKSEITEIFSTDTWLARHAIGELTKRPETNSIWKIQGESAEDGVEKILHQVRKQGEAARLQLATAVDGQAPILVRLTDSPGDIITSWLSVIYSEGSSPIELNLDLSKDNGQRLLSSELVVLDPSSASSLCLCSHWLSELDGYVLKVGMPASVSTIFVAYLHDNKNSEGYLGWDFSADRAHFKNSEEGVSELCSGVLSRIESGDLVEIEAIPNGDIPDAALQIVLLLDARTRDALFSCFGYPDRILASDDPWVRKFASQLGITTVSSVELLILSCFSPSKNIDLQKEIVQITARNLAPNQIPTYLMMHLMSGEYSPEQMELYFKNKLISFPCDRNNVPVLASLISIGLEDKEAFPNLRHLLVVLRGRGTGWSEESGLREIYQLILSSTKRLNRGAEHTSQVIALLLDLFEMQLVVHAPYSSYAALCIALQEAGD